MLVFTINSIGKSEQTNNGTITLISLYSRGGRRRVWWRRVWWAGGERRGSGKYEYILLKRIKLTIHRGTLRWGPGAVLT